MRRSSFDMNIGKLEEKARVRWNAPAGEINLGSRDVNPQ